MSDTIFDKIVNSFADNEEKIRILRRKVQEYQDGITELEHDIEVALDKIKKIERDIR